MLYEETAPCVVACEVNEICDDEMWVSIKGKVRWRHNVVNCRDGGVERLWFVEPLYVLIACFFSKMYAMYVCDVCMLPRRSVELEGCIDRGGR